MTSKTLRVVEAELIQDIDSAFNDITIFERTDMVIATRQKIVNRYNRNSKNAGFLWVTKEFCYNAAGDIVMIFTKELSETYPTWLGEPYPEVFGNN